MTSGRPVLGSRSRSWFRDGVSWKWLIPGQGSAAESGDNLATVSRTRGAGRQAAPLVRVVRVATG